MTEKPVELTPAGSTSNIVRSSPVCTKRLKGITKPFELRLIKGMNPPAPEATVLIQELKTNRLEKAYEQHTKKVLGSNAGISSSKYQSGERRLPPDGLRGTPHRKND
jgi:hypothetical protein